MHIDVTRSSMISAFDYDENTQELIVTFSNGKQYKYSGVPKEAFDAMIANEDSIGRYFTNYIKNKYSCEKL